MASIFTALLKYVIPVITALPELISGIEKLWTGVPKAGAQKWIAVEQALSGSIVAVANQVAALAPDGTKVDEVSAKIAVFTKAVNDAFVKLCNDLGVFQTS